MTITMGSHGPGPGRRQPRQDAEGERRDEEKDRPNAAVARSRCPWMSASCFSIDAAEVADSAIAATLAVDKEPRSRPPRANPDVGTEARAHQPRHRPRWFDGGRRVSSPTRSMPPEPFPAEVGPDVGTSNTQTGPPTCCAPASAAARPMCGTFDSCPVRAHLSRTHHDGK